MARRSSAGVLALLAALAVLVGCVRERPAYYAPVWSPNGTTLTYVAARPDGRLAIRRVDVAASKGEELAASRLAHPPVALAPSPGAAQLACAVMVRPTGQPPTLRLHIIARGGASDRVVWQAPCPRGQVDLCWTPDGKAVFVAADRPDGAALWRVAADGSGAALLADDLSEVRAPAVSSDGKHLAFVARPRPNALWSLYVRSTDGSRTVAAQGLFHTYRVGYWPAWAPRGTVLAYVAERYATPGFAEVWTWDAATSRRHALARALAGACLAPAWAPKGDRLAFVRLSLGTGPNGPGSTGHPADIVVTNLPGNKAKALVADGLANLMPAWSPDGSTIAFNTSADPDDGPHVVRLLDTHTTKVRLAEDSPQARFALAIARHRRGNGTALTQATAHLAAMQAPAAQAYAHHTLARVYNERGRWRLVARHAAQAAAHNDASLRAQSLHLLVNAQMRLGQSTAALATAARLAAAAPDVGHPLHDRIAAAIRTVAACQAELRRKPSPNTLRRMADAQLKGLGNPKAALALYARLVAEFPNYPRRANAAVAVFTCAARLASQPASVRVLASAAAALGDARLKANHLLTLAEAALHADQASNALRWLDRLPSHVPHDRAASLFLQAGRLLHKAGKADAALAAYTRSAHTGAGATAAQASLAAGSLLADQNRHQQAVPHLTAALLGTPDVATLRNTLRLLTRGRLQRADPVAYDIARVAELVRFAYLDSAVKLGEQLITGLAPKDPRRLRLQHHLADGYERLANTHLATDNVARARATVDRWLRWALPQADLPRALAALAACHTALADRRALVDTLTRLTLEFPTSPQAAAARRQLLGLHTAGRH